MLRKISVMAIAVALGSYAWSQDSTKKSTTTISGSLDAYYRYNFHNAKDSGYTNNYTSFTNTSNSFELGMASIKLEHTTGKVGVVADLGFGQRAKEFSYNETGITAAIKQAYVTFAPSDKVKFTMGKWATHVGYELVDAYLNRNYSMSYMFSYGPFSHTGLKADFTFGNVGFMLGVANPTDFISAPFAKKFLLGQFWGASKNGKFKAYLNYQGGEDMTDSKINQADLVLTGTLSDKLSLGYNGTVQFVKPDGLDAENWWGSALYLNFDPTSMFGLTLRGEYLDNKKAANSLLPTTSFVVGTLSANIRIDNLTIIPEFRLDSAKDPVFKKNNDENVKSTGSFVLAATYHF
jgi:hypothetical protein